MMRNVLFVASLSLAVAFCTNAPAAMIVIDVDSNFAPVSSYTQDGYRFRTQGGGTFNVLDGTPDHIVANGATSQGGYILSRLDGKAFTLFGVVRSGAATIGGIDIPHSNTFETFGFPVGHPGVDAVTSVSIELEPGQIFKLAGFTEAVASSNPPPSIPIPASWWLLSAALVPFLRKRSRLTSNVVT